METKYGMLMIPISLCCFILSLSAEEPAPVLDTHGKQVRAGVRYYILPVIRGRGGGLTLGSTSAANKNTTCPLSVVQEDLEVRNGLPLTFTPVNNKKVLVRVSTDHNIKFSTASSAGSSCSSVWKLNSYDESAGKYFITSGGVQGNPGPQTISNWFKIEKLGSGMIGYKLVFCPTVCNFCKVICRDIGIFTQEDGKRRLALTDDQPFAVFFKKAF